MLLPPPPTKTTKKDRKETSPLDLTSLLLLHSYHTLPKLSIPLSFTTTTNNSSSSKQKQRCSRFLSTSPVNPPQTCLQQDHPRQHHLQGAVEQGLGHRPSLRPLHATIRPLLSPTPLSTPALLLLTRPDHRSTAYTPNISHLQSFLSPPPLLLHPLCPMVLLLQSSNNSNYSYTYSFSNSSTCNSNILHLLRCIRRRTIR